MKLTSSDPIPRVGFGLDYQQQPPPVQRRLAQRFGHRLSHVSVVAMSDQTDARTFKSIFAGLPLLHHLSNVAPADADGPHLERLAQLDQLSSELGAVWCGEDIGAWSVGPYEIPYFAPPLFERDVARLVAGRIARVMAHCSVPFLAEVPSCSFVAGRLSLGEFFAELVGGSGCGIVLDVSHVYSYALYLGLDGRDVLRSLPLDFVREVHVAGGSPCPEAPFYYLDNHIDPVLPEVAELLAEAVERCPQLRAVTYEFAAAASDERVDAELSSLETLLAERGFVPRLMPERAVSEAVSLDEAPCAE